MSREARKTAQIWASIEKMQKKEDDLSLSDNSSDKTLKQRKKKKHKRSPSVDHAPSTTGPDTTGASDASNQENNTLTHANLLTLHKSSGFIRNSPFVPPKKKWVSQWETHHHHLGPKVSNKDEGEVAHRSLNTKSEVLASENSSISNQDHTPAVSVSVPPSSDVVPVEGTRPTNNNSASHPASPHHAPQSIHPPHLDHHVTPVPALPSSPRLIVPATTPAVKLPPVVTKDEETEEGEYTASPTRAIPSSAPVSDFALDATPQDHAPPSEAPASSSEATPPPHDIAAVTSGPSPGNESAESTSPSTTTTPAAPASPVMNALGSRRKRKSLWDVGDPRSDDGSVRSNPSSRRPPDGPGHTGRSASADGRRRSWSRSNSNGSNFSATSTPQPHPNHSATAYPPARRHTPPPQQAPSPSFAKPRDPPRSMSSSWLPSR